MLLRTVLFWSVFFLQSAHIVSSAKILGLFAYTGKSHFLVFEPVVKELAKRGHQMTVVSYFEKNEANIKNYKGIQLPPERDTTSFLSMEEFDGKKFTPVDGMNQLYYLTSTYENVLSSKDVQSLVNEKFDLIITEMFNSDVMYGLFHKINAPVIGFSSCDVLPWTNEAMGNSNNPSYFPLILTDLSVSMTLKERLSNLFYLTISRVLYYFQFQPVAQDLAERYFGELPNLYEIASNTTILLVNTHFSIFGAKPTIPAIIEVGGVHLLPVKPLIKNLQDSINEYNSFVYFSMGSVLNSGTMNSEKQKIFFNVFSELKQLVLWKTTIDISEKPKNLISSDWYPQRDILGHPKIDLFISHCGLLGVIEAIDSGVPILCIPMFGDQYHNARALASIEVSLTLQWIEITEESLRNTVNALLNNPKYKENALRISKAFNDRPMSPMDTAIYWIEYVVRHKGAPHINSVIKNLSWYQYYNLDLITIYLFILYIIYKLIIFVSMGAINFIHDSFTSNKKLKTS